MSDFKESEHPRTPSGTKEGGQFTGKIVKVHKVTDTREWEDVDDKWKPIPGSGQIGNCYRCGKEHEIHVEVELDNGQHVTVGTSCSHAGDVESARKRIGSLANASKKKMMWQKEYDKYHALDTQAREHYEKLTHGPRPPIKMEMVELAGKQRPALKMEDATAPMYTSTEEWIVSDWKNRHQGQAPTQDEIKKVFAEENADIVFNYWVAKRMEEKFPGISILNARSQVAASELGRLRKSHPELFAGESKQGDKPNA
jgi:hypothetical protein